MIVITPANVSVAEGRGGLFRDQTWHLMGWDAGLIGVKFLASEVRRDACGGGGRHADAYSQYLPAKVWRIQAVVATATNPRAVRLRRCRTADSAYQHDAD